MAITEPATETMPPPTVAEALAAGAAALGQVGVESAGVDAEWLLAAVLGVPRGRLLVHAGSVLGAAEASRYAALLGRRLEREPLQHVLGTQAFRQITVQVGPAAMVPRPETELLVEWALAVLLDRPAPVIVDVGTGTGCIACAIASERPSARVVALELSPAAAALARHNVACLGLDGRVTVLESDLFGALGARQADLIVANPPYLPTAVIPTLPPEVSRFDPWLALDGGADGADVLRRIACAAASHLVAGGVLLLETAGGDQGRVVARLLDEAGLVGVQVRADLAGVDRFVGARKRS